jgi:hypothetical protein
LPTNRELSLDASDRNAGCRHFYGQRFYRGARNHERSPGKFFAGAESCLGPGDLCLTKRLTLLVQIEAKLQDFIAVVIVIPEEALESGTKEGNGLGACHY